MNRTWLATVTVGSLLFLPACSDSDSSGSPPGVGGSGPGPGPAWGFDDQSCEGASDECEDDGESVSCCLSKPVTGGTFPMGRSEDGPDQCPAEMLCYPTEQPEHDVTVSDFSLDVFEVTVGRFRKFVEKFDPAPPPEGAGTHPRIYESGWNPEWESKVPWSQEELMNRLKCDDEHQTWTDEPGDNETAPINCVSWYLAYLFCAWDGSRLPTEAEWEYASTGGDENRLYPWGGEEPDATRANYADGAHAANTPVGSAPAGQGRFGHHDLAGSVFEFALDWYAVGWYGEGGASCSDCANMEPDPDDAYRVKRGGNWENLPGQLRVNGRHNEDPAGNYPSNGIRCVR